MRVDLRKLKFNPFRDFKIDPIDEAIIDRLVKSIDQDGFWGGVVCRRNKDGDIEIIAGHHRVLAALECKIFEAELYVGDYDDSAVIRVYVRENATQRGNDHGTAMAGSVASAVHFLAKAVLVGTISTIVEKVDLPSVRGNLASDHGIGETLILKFLRDCPGINTGTVKQQLANLKASGDYGRIISEVEAEIKREEEEAAAALAQAEAERKAAEERAAQAREELERRRAERDRKAAEAEAERLAVIQQNLAAASVDAHNASEAADTGVTFDFSGVSQHLKNASQVDAFRAAVTMPNVTAFLPLDRQVDVAVALVKLAHDTKKADGKRQQLTADFIRDNIFVRAQSVMGLIREQTAAEIRAAEERDIHLLVTNLQAEFVQHVHGIHSAGTRLNNVMRKNPDIDFDITEQFRKAVSDAQKIIDQLNRRFGYGTQETDADSGTSVGKGKPQARIAVSR